MFGILNHNIATSRALKRTLVINSGCSNTLSLKSKGEVNRSSECGVKSGWRTTTAE